MAETKDGDQTTPVIEAPPVAERPKQEHLGNVKKKRRRGKSKRKIMKPFKKLAWQERRKNDLTKRNNRYRKMVLAETHAPFNNNQFLMEIHKPEADSNFQIIHTPSARTRDSSFSVDSEENYYYSLPEDEEEYLTKEFSSVYEDAQTERLLNMSKNDLIQEYLLLEAKYENLIKRTERAKPKCFDDKDTTLDKDSLVDDKDTMITELDTSATSTETTVTDEPSFDAMMLRLKEQEEQIRELQISNEKLQLENECLRQRCQSSSEDSESDSSSTSEGDNSSRCTSPAKVIGGNINGDITDESHIQVNAQNGTTENVEQPLVNGFHNTSESSSPVINNQL